MTSRAGTPGSPRPLRNMRLMRTLSMLRTLTALPVLLALLSLPLSPTTTLAQPTDTDTTTTDRETEPTEETLIRWTDETVAAFAAGELDTAAALLDKLIRWQPGNFVHRYNLACVRSRQGASEAAAELLLQAVEFGFSDVNLIRIDPSLNNARETTTVQSMLAKWDEILERRVDTDLEGINISPDRLTAFWEHAWTGNVATRLQASHAFDRAHCAGTHRPGRCLRSRRLHSGLWRAGVVHRAPLLLANR